MSRSKVQKVLMFLFRRTCAKYIKLYISYLKKKKKKQLNSVGQVRSYIDYVFILSPAADAFQCQQESHS